MKSMRCAKVLTALLFSLFASAVRAQGDGAPRRSKPYDPAMVDAIARLPVQEEGRVKPFSTLTDYILVRLNERVSLSLPKDGGFGELAGTKLSSTEWALDLILYPEQARDYPVFVVTDREVLDLIGLSEIGNTKRGRHSWNELEPGIGKLQELVAAFGPRDANSESRIQDLTRRLFRNLVEYNNLESEFHALQSDIDLPSSRELTATFPGRQGQLDFVSALSKFSALRFAFEQLDPEKDPSGAPDPHVISEREAIAAVLNEVSHRADRATTLSWFAPPTESVEVWDSFGSLATLVALSGPDGHRPALGALSKLETLVRSVGDPNAVRTAGLDFAQAMRALSSGRADAGKIDLEVSYRSADWFSRAMFLFLFAFLSITVSWLRPGAARWPIRIGWSLAILAEVLLIAGIVQRCILISRPPVATLYETILFITSMLVMVAFVIEWIGKRRIALPLAAFLGAVGMFVAYRFEVHRETDTIEEVQAVLRTNFWLGVHVTTVTIGYASTLLAGFIAHVFLIGKLFGAKRNDAGFYPSVVRMVYGVLCFATLFSTFGTIAGGIWANDSWGRFWGWDPKENGALMIVLWQLIVLHGRLGGLWRNWGICFLAVLGNCVVAFSWWHVNALAIGLHSYGFDAGLLFGTCLFYGSQALILICGMVALGREKLAQKRESVGGPDRKANDSELGRGVPSEA